MIKSSASLVGLVALVALAPWLASGRQAAIAPPDSKITAKALLARADLKWVPLPGIPGAEQVMLWGDTAKGPHRAFFKFPVGLKAPLHTHSAGDRGVILSGTLSLAVEGAAPKKLGAGSYFSLPAGTPHITAVEGEEPCVFFIEREGPFDVVVVEPPGKE